MYVKLRVMWFSLAYPEWGEGVNGFDPIESLEFLVVCFHKNTVQTLLLNSLNPKFCT